MQSSASSEVREWLTLAETTAALEKSGSTIERLVVRGSEGEPPRLRSKLEPRPGRKPERVYHAGDVERLKAEASPGVGRQLVRQNAPRNMLALTLPDGIGEAVRELASAIAYQADKREEPVALTVREKLWLSLDEAAEYSGLAKSDLLHLCKLAFHEQAGSFARRLPGMLVVRKSGGWKILRKSLEAFEG